MLGTPSPFRKFEFVRRLQYFAKPLFMAICTALLLCAVATESQAQFSGSLQLSGNSSNNVAGTDSSAPDKAFAPSLDLAYRFELSTLSSINLEASYSPYWYTASTDRSFTKLDFSVMGNFYLSENLEKKEQIKTSSSSTTPIKKDTLTSLPLTHQAKAPVTTRDNIPLVASSLSMMSERLDSIDIDTTLIHDEDSIDEASDLKDSLSESVLALSEILASENYSESIQSVIVDELSADQLLLAQIALPKIISDRFKSVLNLAKKALETQIANSDLIHIPESPLETKPLPATTIEKLKMDGLDLRAIVSLKEDAPIITLINSATNISDFGATDATISEDLLPKTSLTLATLLSIPITLESQKNQPRYDEFSYTQFVATPRLIYYPSSILGFDAQYGFTSFQYPNDSLFVYDEHRIRLDGKFAIGSFLVIAAQFGASFRDYNHPLVDTTFGVRGNVLKISKGTENFSQTQFGLSSTFFITSQLNIGLGAAITKSSQLRSYLIDALVGRSLVGGKASDDDYSYHLTKFFFYIATRPFWGIDVSADLAFEKHEYGKGINTKRIANAIQERTDKGTSITVDLSRDIFFDQRLISIFETLTPEVNFQYSSIKSTMKQYTYHYLTTTLSLSLGF